MMNTVQPLKDAPEPDIKNADDGFGGYYDESDPVLGRYVPRKQSGLVIARIAGSFFYVKNTITVSDLADALIGSEDVHAVAVVDEGRRVEGVVIRRELFDLLGKPFGRDLYTHKTVSSVMTRADSFRAGENIFVVSEEISPRLTLPVVTDYVLLTDDGRFAGIFSTRDMLIYLSEITRKDIQLARRLQMSMVKEELYETSERFSVIGSSAMAKGVGGDYYAFKRQDADNWFFTVCDVSGKGMAASLVTSIIGGMLSIYDFSAGTRHFVIKLNEYIYTTFESERFVTGVFAAFNARTGDINLIDAGHSYLYLYRDGRMTRINTRDDNVPLGVRSEFLPKGAKFTMRKGDLAVFLTDGVLEQTNPAGEEYGISRLAAVIEKYRAKGLKRLSLIHISEPTRPY